MRGELASMLRGAVRVLVWTVVVGVVLGVVLVVTVLAAYFFGLFALLIPVGVFVLAGALVTRVPTEKCPRCGGPLRPAVIEWDRGDVPDGAPRLRAVYTCEPHGHRSWRWAREGGPLRGME